MDILQEGVIGGRVIWGCPCSQSYIIIHSYYSTLNSSLQHRWEPKVHLSVPRQKKKDHPA